MKRIVLFLTIEGALLVLLGIINKVPVPGIADSHNSGSRKAVALKKLSCLFPPVNINYSILLRGNQHKQMRIVNERFAPLAAFAIGTIALLVMSGDN
jgi:hypothetical protein